MMDASKGPKTMIRMEDTLFYPFIRLTSSTAMVPRLLAQLGVPVEPVLGYGSTARMLIAVESGEAAGFFLSEDSVTRRADLQRKGIIIPLLQTRPVVAGLPLLQDERTLKHFL